MKKILFIAAVMFSLAASAQVTEVSLQASGLTCSMCSNAINKSLKTIGFVEKVDANIKTSTFQVTFKPGSKVDFDQLKKKVEDAGFFVAKLEANIRFDNNVIEADEHLSRNGITFHFLNAKGQTLNGIKTVRIMDKGFVPAKEYKKNSRLTTMECYKTGVAESCCAKDGLASGTRILHVTI